jgi:hypothetical protein
MRDAQAAAGSLALQLQVLHARTERDFDAAFANPVQPHNVMRYGLHR